MTLTGHPDRDRKGPMNLGPPSLTSGDPVGIDSFFGKIPPK